jgi:hypothetical protein
MFDRRRHGMDPGDGDGPRDGTPLPGGDTSEFPEEGAKGVATGTGTATATENTEDTDRGFGGDGQGENREWVPIRSPKRGESFFPDVPEQAPAEDGSNVSGILRTADDISRIVALNRPRPGPFLRWYIGLEPRQRRRVYKGLWMLGASLLIVSLFSLATEGVFPLMEDRFTASFGPRPDEPVRTFPEPGALFGLVEERPYRHDRFVAGLDCIWITADPVRSPRIAVFGPYLSKGGEVVAVLDVENTWSGMYRLYFDRGDLPLEEPVDLVIPIRGGGTVPLSEGPGYRLRVPGGDLPARVVLGPLEFR